MPPTMNKDNSNLHLCHITKTKPAQRWGLQPNAQRLGGGGKHYPPLTQKQRAVEIHRRRQSKARNEKVQMSSYFVFNKGQM